MIGTLFRNKRSTSQAETLFSAIAEQARHPALYIGGAAPDTVEGRFDVLAIHMALALSRLKSAGPAGLALAEPLQREFFDSLDDAMRRLGVGDTAVARKVRRMAEAFYGRFLAYEAALDAADAAALADAVSRNLFGETQAATGPAFARYMMAARDRLAASSAPDGLAEAVRALAALANAVFGDGDRHDGKA